MPTFQADLEDGSTIEFEAEKQPTEQELAQALHQHLSTKVVGPPPEAPPQIGAGRTFLEHAATGIGPGAAFIAGAAPGATVGAEAGSFLGPLGAAVGGTIGGLVTGVPSAWAASKLQHAALNVVAPEFTKKLDIELAQGEEQHPLASIAGDVASFGPSAKLAPFKLAQLPFRAALGAGVGAGLPLLRGDKVTGKDLVEGVASGILFGEPRFKLLPKATAAAGKATLETLSKLKGAKTTPKPSEPATEAAGADHDALERAAIDAGEVEGSPVKIVDTFSAETPDQPFARQFMKATPAGIEVKRGEFQKWLADVPPEQQQAAIQQRIAEEHIHRHVSGEDAAAYWDSLSHVEKVAETRAYTGEWSQEAYKRRWGGNGFTNTQMGHEALRRRMQRLATGTSSEIAEAAFKEHWKLEMLDGVSRTVRTIRETLGTDASKTGLAILGRIEANLDAARAVIGKPTDPDWQVTVQESQTMPDGKTVVPGYVQIDDVSGGQNKWSKNPQTLRQEGFAVPTGIEKLPSGKYSMADVQRMTAREQPAALRKGGSEEPEFPGIAKATRGKGVLSQPEKSKTGPGIDIPEQVISPAAVSEAAAKHFTESARPSFPDFVAEVKTRLGPVQPGQLREVFQDAMWKRLQEMPGAELGKLQAKFGTQKEEAAIKGFAGHIADPPPPDKGFQLGYEMTPLARYLDKEGKARITQAQRTRNTVIANIAERLMGEAQEGRKAWHRKEITPDDIRYGAFEDQRQPSWQELSQRDLSDPQALGRRLTDDFRASKDDALSATKRVTVAVAKDGSVHAVSTYRQPARGGMPEHAKLLDPLSSKLRAHVTLDAFLKRYRPIASALLDEPVQSFHQKWGSVAEFEKDFGQEARERSANAQYDPAGYSATEGEFAPSETGSKVARPGVYQDQPGSWDKTGTITDAEAGAIIDHVLEESGSFEGPADVQASLAALGERTNRQAVSGYRKLFAALEEKLPNATDEELLNKLADQLYENHKASQTYENFTARTLAQGRGENRPIPPAQAAPSQAGQELTMPINRVPPTTMRPEMLPPGYQGPERRPAPAVPEGSLTRPESAGPAALRKVLEPAADELKAIGENVKAIVRNRATNDEIVRTAAAASNIPHNLARQAETGVRIQSDTKGKRLLAGVAPKPEVLSAANALVQSGFDQTRIADFQSKVRAGAVEARRMAASPQWRERRIGAAWLRATQELKAELDYADAHWNDPDLQATAKRIKKELDKQLALEKASGLDISKNADYLPQRYDAELWSGDSVLMRGLFKGLPEVLGRKFKEARVFDSYYDAIANGPYIAATRDGASLVGHRVRQGLTQIMRKGWQEGLKAVMTPDGKPLAIEPKMLKGGGWGSPSQGYVEVLQKGGKPLIIHQDFANLVKNLTSESPIEASVIGRNLLHLTQRIKHTLLVGDFFHMARMGYYATAIMGKNTSWSKGWSILDIAPGDVNEAVRRGIIRPEDAAWGRGTVDYNGVPMTRQQLAERFQELGANVGMIQDALYKDLITKLTPTAGPIRRGIVAAIDPTAGRYNRFLFDKLTRGLMMESNVREFERQSKANPGLNHDALVRDIAKDVNNFFGNIGQQGWFKAKWQQDIARMVFLAPQWVEGLIMKEATAASRLSGLSKLTGQREGLTALGTTGTGIGKGLLFMLGLTQAINLISRRQPTWQNEEKGHKMDAWIPALGGSSEGFWLSPMAIFNELAHDVYRLTESKPKGIEAFQQIAGNKESPLTRAALLALVGKSPTGEYQTTTAGTLKEAGKQLAPIPITFGKYAQAIGHAVAPSVVPANPPGAVQRQILSTFGIKVEPKMGAAGEVARMAKDFMKREGLDKETGWTQIQNDLPGYTKMRQALRSGDQSAARSNLNALRKQHTDQQIIKAMTIWAKRGFTGSQQTERQFMASLNDKQMAAYGQAVDGKYRDLESFYDLITQ